MSDQIKTLEAAPDYALKDHAAFSHSVMAQEWELIRARREKFGINREEPNRNPSNTDGKPSSSDEPFVVGGLVGLALSGGGIRSAMFSLGVMQALAKHDVMKHVDILSTVSGGGFIGSSLTWWCSRFADKSVCDSDKKFPFGKNNIQGIACDTNDQNCQRIKFLRENGNYLTRNLGWKGILGGISVVVRGILLNLLVWLPILAVFGSIAHEMSLGDQLISPLKWVTEKTVFGLLAFFVVYSLLTYFSSEKSKSRFVFASYRWRRWLEISAGVVLIVSIVCGITLFLSCLGRGDDCGDVFNKLAENDTLKLLTEGWPGYLVLGLALGFRGMKSDSQATASISLQAGLAITLVSFIMAGFTLGTLVNDFIAKGGEYPPAQMMTDLIPAFLDTSSELIIASVLCISLFWIGKYALAKLRRGITNRLDVQAVLKSLLYVTMVFGIIMFFLGVGDALDRNTHGPIWASIFVLAFVLGTIVNVNYISLHRFYRDRLMETFMPDPDSIKSDRASAEPAKLANNAKLGDFQNELSPYHIVNTNLILVNSTTPKFKSRKGDNFILSPLYCGGNAVGWKPTKRFMRNRLTLATSVAISGAAANPNAQSGGVGLATKPIVGFFMAMLNIRLGNWVPNPRYSDKDLIVRKPNHFWPTAAFELSKFLGLKIGFNEKSSFVEISDGAHFENTGMYELLRRRARLIICCDGGADLTFAFTDIIVCLERAVEDFGLTTDLDADKLQPMMPVTPSDGGYPNGAEFSDTPFTIINVTYADKTEGKIVFIKTALVEDVSFKTLTYKEKNPDFPDQTTADQFFDPDQVDAYRDLGFCIGNAVMDEDELILVTEHDSVSLSEYVNSL